MAGTIDDTDRVRLHLEAGVPLGPDLRLTPRVQRAVSVAQLVGAPLLGAIESAAAAEEDAARSVRAVAVATAQSRTVALGLVLAPVLLVPVIGRLAGADVVAFYLSPLGRGVLGVGLLLLGAGALVARALVARVGQPHPDAALEEAVELTATAIAGGSGTAAALRTVAAVLPAQGDRLRRLALDLDLGVGLGVGVDARRIEAPDGGTPRSSLLGAIPRTNGRGAEPDALRRLRVVIVTAASVGAPSAGALLRLARDLRAAELARVLAAAERLPAQLTFPTTLLLLPATVLLIAAPLLDAGLQRVAG
jgi:pilus assembly protein TadC